MVVSERPYGSFYEHDSSIQQFDVFLLFFVCLFVLVFVCMCVLLVVVGGGGVPLNALLVLITGKSLLHS